MKRNRRFYLVEADVRYYQDKFNSGYPGGLWVNNPEFIAEFIRYADFIEQEFAYQIQVINFPQVFLTKFVTV